MHSITVLLVAVFYHQGIKGANEPCTFPTKLHGIWKSLQTKGDIDRGTWNITSNAIAGIKINNTETTFSCNNKSEVDNTYILAETKTVHIFNAKIQRYTCIEIAEDVNSNKDQLYYKMKTERSWIYKDRVRLYAVQSHSPEKDAMKDICSAETEESGKLTKQQNTGKDQRGSSDDLFRRFLEDEMQMFMEDREEVP